ncbi:extracellular solute-binding protein [Kitasatospora albolonga]|uniref:ABC transporter substrate-binding protein n=1 Tax=Kitasatospora albolonga TaxID=68173 RepID=UPI0031E692EF
MGSRFVATTAATVLLLAMTAACGSGGGASGGDSGTIHVMVYGDATNKVEKQLVDTFNKTSPVKVVLDTVPGADYQQKLQTVINTPQAPDVFFNWGGGSIQPFVKADLLLPLDEFIAKDPGLKTNFLPSVFNSAVVDGKPYGVPMRGTQPVLLFHNKKVLADAGLTPPKTWDELLTTTKALKAKGITPIALGGADKWPTLMWFEYLYDRVAGPGLFQKAVEGDKAAWAGEDSRKALAALRELTDTGAFGTNFDSVKFTDGGSPALGRQGQGGLRADGLLVLLDPAGRQPRLREERPRLHRFPSVTGGKGEATAVVGNTNNFYSVLKKTKHPEAAAAFLKLMYSDEFVKAQLAVGNLPTTTNTVNFLDTAASPEYSKYQFELVKAAPSFQLSWDQAYPPSAMTPLQTAIQQFFNGKLDADGFVKAMQALPTS